MATKKLTLGRDLARLPVGLRVAFTPSSVYAHPARTTSRWAYRWLLHTTVQVTGPEPLSVEAFGVAVLTGRWAYATGQSLSLLCGGRGPRYTVFQAGDFCRRFDCPTGSLEPGVVYANSDAWVGAARLRAGRFRCVVIACDENGQRYKGVGDAELQGWMTI